MATMYLITEGDSDALVMDRLLKQKGIRVHLRHRAPSGGGGIPQLAMELTELIDAALTARGPRDCIVVLHDADEFSEMHPKHRQHYQRIRDICLSERYRESVTLITAHDEVEAWLLADEQLCDWLSIAPQKGCDSLAHPKEELKRLIRKKNARLDWSVRYWSRILEHVDASGDHLSPSMRKAFEILRTLPCTQS